MELALDRGGEQPEYARVKKRLKENQGRPIGIASDNPILDTRMYEVEYQDGHTAALAENLIADNLFALLINLGEEILRNDTRCQCRCMAVLILNLIHYGINNWIV